MLRPPTLALCSLLLLPLLAPIAAAQTEWRDLTEREALEQARAEHQPLLILFTAPGCLACHRMDAVVWPDAELGEWIEKNAVAIRIGLDSLEEAMTRLGVQGFPTLLRLEDGVETARLIGFHTADELLAWLRDPSALDPPPADAIVGVGAPVGDVYDYGVTQLVSGEPAAAARALAEFWMRAAVEPGVTPTLQWIRRDRLPSMLAKLGENDDARAAIGSLLEGFPEAGPEPTDNPELVRDWITLSRALKHDDSLNAWIDSNLKTEEGVRRLALQRGVFDRLVEQGRWDDAGRVASPAMWGRWVARLHQEPTGDPVSDAMPSIAIEKERERAPEQIERFVRALRAAGRNDEAQELESIHE